VSKPARSYYTIATRRGARTSYITMTLIYADALPVLRNLPARGARCRDCDKDTMPVKANGKPNFKAWVKDHYLVSDEAWIEAGMARKSWAPKKRWDTGFLCMSCLRRRLGRRPVRGKDLIVWSISAVRRGLKIAATVEYMARIYRRGY